MTEIRELQPPDYPFLWTMLYESIYSPVQPLPQSIIHEPSVANYAASFGRDGDHGFVLTSDGQLRGAAWSRLFRETDKNYGFVDESTPELAVAIDAAFRGQGHGQQLLERLINKLFEEGYSQLSLSVDRRNRAVNLYRRMGFAN